MKRSLGFDKKVDCREPEAAGDSDGDSELQLVPGLSNLYSPQVSEQTHVRDIVDVLSELGKISGDQAEQIRNQQQKKGTDVEQLILKAGVGDDDILMAKARLYGFEFRHIEAGDVDRSAFEKLDLGYIRTSHVIPIGIEGDRKSVV